MEGVAKAEAVEVVGLVGLEHRAAAARVVEVSEVDLGN